MGENCHATARKRSMKIDINLSKNAEKIAANKAQRNVKSPFILAKEKIIFFLKGENILFQLVDTLWNKTKNILNRHTFWHRKNESIMMLNVILSKMKLTSGNPLFFKKRKKSFYSCKRGKNKSLLILKREKQSLLTRTKRGENTSLWTRIKRGNREINHLRENCKMAQKRMQ